MYLSIIPAMSHRSKALLSRRSNIVNYIHRYPAFRAFTFSSENDIKVGSDSSKKSSSFSDVKVEKVKISACGDVDSDDDGEMVRFLFYFNLKISRFA